MGDVKEYKSVKPYGFDSYAPIGAMCLLSKLNNDASNNVGVEYDNKKRYADLKSGEVVLYNPENNSHVLIKEDKTIEIGVEDFEKIVKATKLKNWIKDEINSVFNAHTHAVTTAPGITSAPASSMSDPSETDIASSLHTVGD